MTDEELYAWKVANNATEPRHLRPTASGKVDGNMTSPEYATVTRAAWRQSVGLSKETI